MIPVLLERHHASYVAEEAWPLMRTELVGRERELAALLEHLESALDTHPRVVLCRGAPGIGKTRMAEELTGLAARRGVPVAWGPAAESSGAPPYWPWRQVLRAMSALSALTCNLLNETIMHGYDIAHAAGRKWRIEPFHAAMVVRQFFVPVVQTADTRTFVNAEKAANLQATYQLHLRGSDRLNWVFDDGSLRIEERSTRRVDCHILADPAALFMVFWERQSQWNAIAKGQLIAWGRKPWLGLKFRSLIRNL